MAARRKKKSNSRNFSLVQKGIVSGLLVAVIFGVGYEWIALNHPNSGVLGTQSLFARGGDDNEADSGDRGQTGQQKVEIHIPDSNVGSGKIETPNAHIEANKEKIEVHLEKHNIEPTDKPDQNDASNEADTEDIKVASSDGETEIHGKFFGARSHFPISVDPITHEMTITTPAGTKTVTVLPDKAAENMLTKGILSKIGDNASSSASTGDQDGGTTSGAFGLSAPAGTVLGNNQNIELTTDNGTPVYKIQGSKSKKFLGLIPVNINKTVTVSGDTGEVTSTQLSFFSRFLDFLSF